MESSTRPSNIKYVSAVIILFLLVIGYFSYKGYKSFSKEVSSQNPQSIPVPTAPQEQTSVIVEQSPSPTPESSPTASASAAPRE